MEHVPAGIQAGEEPSLPDHLIRLPGGRSWAVWRWVGLRATGFPAVQVLALAAPASAALADQLLRAEEEARQAQDAALDALWRELRVIDKDKRSPLRKAKDQIKRGKSPSPLEASWAGAAALDSFRGACASVDSARANFQQVFDAT